MDIDEILNIYYQGMTEVELQQRSVTSVAKGQMELLDRRLQEVGGDKGHKMGGHSMAFQHPVNNEWIFYGGRTVTISESFESTQRHENRQYQWLLVEAYEQFEIFLIFVYAYVGAQNIALWTDREREKLPDGSTGSPPFESCLEAAKVMARSKGAEFVLNSLRRIVPNLSKVEKTNASGVSLLLATNVIAQMRHHIVHTRGEVRDLETFKKRIFEKCGRASDRHFISGSQDFINNFFRYVQHRTTICLIKIPMDNGFSHMDILSSACNLLLAHAFLVVMELKACFNQHAN